mgnify:CR=1 FL=1
MTTLALRAHGMWNIMNRTNGRQRFIILTDQRSGSNHLGDLLDSHLSVRVAGELFNPDEILCATCTATLTNLQMLRK